MSLVIYGLEKFIENRVINNVTLLGPRMKEFLSRITATIGEHHPMNQMPLLIVEHKAAGDFVASSFTFPVSSNFYSRLHYVPLNNYYNYAIRPSFFPTQIQAHTCEEEFMQRGSGGCKMDS